MNTGWENEAPYRKQRKERERARKIQKKKREKTSTFWLRGCIVSGDPFSSGTSEALQAPEIFRRPQTQIKLIKKWSGWTWCHKMNNGRTGEDWEGREDGGGSGTNGGGREDGGERGRTGGGRIERGKVIAQTLCKQIYSPGAVWINIRKLGQPKSFIFYFK